ncbi:MAG TPA: nuclear transport factor 2 family protein [Rubrobacteraceae bacterium]|nr:nuclear transport factor 2 family protein [Rubrobacteraceae bacterium]
MFLSQEVAERFKEALWKLEEDRDVEGLVEIHAEDCNVGNVAVPKTFSGHEGLREFWTNYRNTFDQMKSEFRNVFADDAGHAALEWTTEGTEGGETVSYGGVSILEIEDGKVKRFMAYFDPRSLTEQIVD